MENMYSSSYSHRCVEGIRAAHHMSEVIHVSYTFLLPAGLLLLLLLTIVTQDLQHSLNTTVKFTNPADGILNLCKQKLRAPPVKPMQLTINRLFPKKI